MYSFINWRHYIIKLCLVYCRVPPILQQNNVCDATFDIDIDCLLDDNNDNVWMNSNHEARKTQHVEKVSQNIFFFNYSNILFMISYADFVCNSIVLNVFKLHIAILLYILFSQCNLSWNKSYLYFNIPFHAFCD